MEKSYSEIAKRFQNSYMSNSKWLKFFKVLGHQEIPAVFAEWKFINEERIFYYSLPRKGQFNEIMLLDGYFAPIEFKWIQWIRIPKYPTQPHTNQKTKKINDLEMIKKKIEDCGSSFNLQKEGSALILTAYS